MKMLPKCRFWTHTRGWGGGVATRDPEAYIHTETRPPSKSHLLFCWLLTTWVIHGLPLLCRYSMVAWWWAMSACWYSTIWQTSDKATNQTGKTVWFLQILWTWPDKSRYFIWICLISGIVGRFFFWLPIYYGTTTIPRILRFYKGTIPNINIINR